MKSTYFLKQYLILFALGLLSFSVSAQFFTPDPAKNWQNESFDHDTVYGTESDKALELLKGRTPTPVVVAVIDGGVYVSHPALKPTIWVNPKEIPGNKIDDDHNGYVDDVNGWDFIGGKDSAVKQDNLEVTRLYRDLKEKFDDLSPAQISKEDKADYAKYQKVKKEFESKYNEYMTQYTTLKGFADTMAMLKKAIGKDFNQDDVTAYNPSDSAMSKARRKARRNFNRFSAFVKGATGDSLVKLLGGALDYYNNLLKYNYNVDFNPRYIVNDNYGDVTQRYYGNNNVSYGPTAEHGTHVSGIIAGVRTNKPGAQEGIADDAKIMAVRVVPDGDERDKDVANGIRYAVDNGARVINMSFGKAFSCNKQTVDEAVKYAEAHDVLLVHAAGNDHNDNDSTDNFPNRTFEGTHKQAQNWIEVGASDTKGKPASFSNYGKRSVDLFAPGVQIYSSVPDSAYGYLSGTSMAAPCVTGVAAIIREYFPKLTAKQVKKILMESVTPITFKVSMPGHPAKIVTYSDLCISGGIVNAYKAVQLAMKEAK